MPVPIPTARFAALVAAGRPWAQTTSATLSGRVALKDGTPVSAALVQARSSETGTSRTATTDAAGRYRIDPLAPGSWSIVARSPDGVLSDTKSILLRLQQDGIVDLVIGTGLEEEVTVRAEAPLFDSRRTVGEMRIGDAQVQGLPVPGDSVTEPSIETTRYRPFTRAFESSCQVTPMPCLFVR